MLAVNAALLVLGEFWCFLVLPISPMRRRDKIFVTTQAEHGPLALQLRKNASAPAFAVKTKNYLPIFAACSQLSAFYSFVRGSPVYW